MGLSVVLTRKDNVSGAVELAFTDRQLAESAFAALVNIVFISLVAIMPTMGIGHVRLIMALIGLANAYRLFGRFREARKKEGRTSCRDASPGSVAKLTGAGIRTR